ncbi:MAG: hypothetical protein QNK85_09640 [Crocinitomicaceae bacterium]
MSLKVIRYKNHGCMWEDDPNSFLEEEKSDEWLGEVKINFSFYELNNGRNLHLFVTEYWKEGKSNEIEFESYSNWVKLKNGEIHKYEFGMDFWDWFWTPGGDNNIVEYEEKPSKEEMDCVMEFYWKHVHEKREETQETITL